MIADFGDYADFLEIGEKEKVERRFDTISAKGLKYLGRYVELLHWPDRTKL